MFKLVPSAILGVADTASLTYAYSSGDTWLSLTSVASLIGCCLVASHAIWRHLDSAPDFD